MWICDDLPREWEYAPEYFNWLFDVWFTQGGFDLRFA
jgi:hypothetical protein